MTSKEFVARLTAANGGRGVLTDPRATERWRKGWRSGGGDAEAVVAAHSLLELWRVLKVCVENDRIVIMQAANTGLTEGSAPSGEYDRPVVVINTLKLDRLHVLGDGRQIVSHAGGTLYALEKLLKPLGRQPHSVIGSSCIGASVVGGVCNNSGGALVRRGPAYTELALYAQVTADGRLELVNHLGLRLGDTPEAMLERLERGNFTDADIDWNAGRASQDGYADKVRDVEAASPARFNADPGGLHEASGCAGKLAVFAVRLDTFPEEKDTRVFYVGTNDPTALAALRRALLTDLPSLPISGEYLHRTMFDIAHRYGKDSLLLIHWLGTDWLPTIFTIKGQIDARLNKIRFLPRHFADRVLQALFRFAPEALPARMRAFRERFEHHLILKVDGDSVQATEAALDALIGSDGWFACDAAEAKKAMLHRFVAAGAAVRYQAVHDDAVEEILALDVALRRNDQDWVETLPPDIERDIVAKLYYGHFLCHVFHQDYILRKGVDARAMKARMLALLDRRGAEYPAEHNVGHLYEAKPQLRAFYESLDPTNSFNPGIGKTSKQRRPATACCEGKSG